MSLQTGIDSLATRVANYLRDTVWPAINAKFDKTGGTLTGPVVLTGQASPANPAAGTLAVFAKTDNKLYTLTSAGVEAELGAGGGAVADGSVTNTKLADMAANTIKGRITALGVPQDLTAANVKTILALTKTDVGLGNVNNVSSLRRVAVFTALANEPPATNFATLDIRNSRPVLDFDTTTQETAIFSGVMPGNYAAGGLTVTLWSSLTSAITGTLGYDIAFEAVSGLDTDSDSFATAKVAAAATVPGTSGVPMQHTVTFTNSEIDGLAASGFFRLRVRRDVATDTAAGDAELIAVIVDMT